MMHRCSILLCLGFALNAAAQLSGTYTVGGGGANYATPAAAFAALNAQGASGDVTFLVNAGTYTGQYSLGPIGGTPGTILVRSISNNAADVVFEYDAAFPLENHILELDGVQHLHFEDVTFHALNNDRARILHFFNNTDDLKLWDCVLIGSQSTNTNSYLDRVLVHCDQNDLNTTDNADLFQVLGCEFRYGSQAIEFAAEGNGGARATAMMIAESDFTDQLIGAINILNATGEITQNRITTSAANGYTGIRTSYFDGGSKVQRNVIQAHALVSGCTGIEFGNTQFTTDNHISNNMVTVSAAAGEVWGIGVYNLWGMAVVYNSVAVTDGFATSKAFYHLSNFADGQELVMRNNLFVNYADGTALESTVAGNIVTEDHNDLYTTGTVLASTGGTEYTTLAAYQSGTGDGANDLHVDPAFPFLPDLHLNSCVLDGAGDWYNIPLGDIDYQARGNPVCDIGADEFTYTNGVASSAIVVAVGELPVTLEAPNGSGYDWSQGSTAQSIQVVAAGVYTCTFTDVNGCSYTLSWTLSVDFSTDLEAITKEVLRAFPDPADDLLMITGVKGNVRFAIYTAAGQCVRTGTHQADEPLPLDGLGPGLHVLHIMDGSRVHGTRFIKR
jgi:hypothetical protein